MFCMRRRNSTTELWTCVLSWVRTSKPVPCTQHLPRGLMLRSFIIPAAWEPFAGAPGDGTSGLLRVKHVLYLWAMAFPMGEHLDFLFLFFPSKATNKYYQNKSQFPKVLFQHHRTRKGKGKPLSHTRAFPGVQEPGEWAEARVAKLRLTNYMRLMLAQLGCTCAVVHNCYQGTHRQKAHSVQKSYNTAHKP